MSWNLILRPEVESDVEDAAEWYESRNPGLGREFREEIISALEEIAENPLIHCRRHPHKNIRWRYPKRFPYRVVYVVAEEEKTVVVAAVMHAARHDRHWRQRT